MALKIRLRQMGKKNFTVYRLVLMDARCKRDGKYLELLGWYNPFIAEDAKKAELKGDKINHWLGQGAVPSEKALELIRRFCPDVMSQYNAKLIAKATKKREEAKKRRA